MRSRNAIWGFALLLSRPAEGIRRLRQIYEVPENNNAFAASAAIEHEESWLFEEEDLSRILTESSVSFSMSFSMPSSDPPPTPSPPPNREPPTPPEDRETQIQQKCGTSVADRSDMILSTLMTVSDSALLIDPASTRYKARMWIDMGDEALICGDNGQRIIQRYILALFYYQMTGPLWTTCRADHDHGDCPEGETRYLDARNECLWFGVRCENVPDDPDAIQDEFYPVTRFVLKENNLRGELMEELYYLTSLTHLFMDTNGISGQLSPSIGRLTDLEELDLDDNEISGELPEELFGLTKLKVIDLDTNQLVGTLSPSIGNLKDLEVLQLENQGFTGPVPTDALLNLGKLVALTLDDNGFTGSVEPLCDVLDERRQENNIYLMFFFVDCAEVECSCCTCADESS